MDWKIFDNPKETKWHSDDCVMAVGKDERNIPIIAKSIVWAKSFPSSGSSSDSGYDTASASGSSCGMSARSSESQFMVSISN